jgi:hypothetical protein
VNSINQPTQSNRTNTPSDGRLPGLFWKFGAEFHGNEAIRADLTDFFVFSLIGVLCLWPIVSVALTIARVIG